MIRGMLLLLATMALALVAASGTAMAAESQLDQQQTSSDSTLTVTSHGAYQTFTARKSGTLDKVSLYIGCCATEGVPTSNLLVAVRDAEVQIPASSFTNDGSLNWVDIPFDTPTVSPPTVQAGQQYNIWLKTSGAAPNYLWGYNSADSYSGGELSFCFRVQFPEGAGHTQCQVLRPSGAESSADAAFKTYVTDATPPQTTINFGPSGTVSDDTATFYFYTNEVGSTFECRLDSTSEDDWSECSSPKQYTNLTHGQHTFSVRATDTSGNTDPTPDSRTWKVDTTAPTVDSISPADGAINVALTTHMEATFSESMDPSSITDETFTLTDLTRGALIAADVSYDSASKKAILVPASPLEAGHEYVPWVKSGTGGVKDVAGNELEIGPGWRFTATWWPRVESYTPTQTTGVSRRIRPTATFSTDMDASTITPRYIKFQVYDQQEKKWINVAHSVSYDEATRTATVTPGSTLAASKKYRVTVTTNVRSITGHNVDQDPTNNLGLEPKRWTFTIR